ncbi:MAG: hypothetical protein ACTHMC_21590 [Pseudobacter sp.]|uniref:hypothetical protein n=1 Tax=Pseudobacter sp. TaxID=2045420 RepID=UPI003F7FC6FA
MRKILSWIFIIAGVGVMVISTSPTIMEAIVNYRQGIKGAFGERKSRGGDLMRMSYLDREDRFIYEGVPVNKKPDDTSSKKNIDLYVYGDSYMLQIPDSSVFARVRKYSFGRRDYEDLVYRLDPSQKNVLLIELSERFVRTYLPYYKVTYDHLKPAAEGLSTNDRPQPYSASLFDLKHIFNPGINSNIEYNLFNYNFLNGPRYWKASKTYRWFHRVSGDVVLSEDGQFLFYRPTVDPENEQSSFAPVSGKLLQELGDHLASLYDHYQKAGFDEVIFSVIPSPVTILQPKGYNRVIPVLQEQLEAKSIPYVDAYTNFSNYADPFLLYRRDDTHWSTEGCHLWLEILNRQLVTISEN